MVTRKIFILFLLPIIILFSGCLATLHPFFFEKDVENAAHLIGQWSYSEGDNYGVLLIEKIPAERKNELSGQIKNIADKGYFISWRDSTGRISAQYFAFLAKIGKHYYFDYYPAETTIDKKINIAFKIHYRKLHSCYKVNFSNFNQFEIKLFDKGFLDKLIDERKLMIKYEQEYLEGKKVITASTEELQEYLKKYSDNEKAFSRSFTCKRIAL
jgi:hypothetical protein